MFQSSFLFRLSLLALIIGSVAMINNGRMLARQGSNASAQSAQLINGYPQFQLNGQAFFAHSTAFFYNGKLIEFGDTRQLFTKPREQQTEDYITGRFG